LPQNYFDNLQGLVLINQTPFVKFYLFKFNNCSEKCKYKGITCFICYLCITFANPTVGQKSHGAIEWEQGSRDAMGGGREPF
jgi:hypothetical protein